jgi:hypothetical protein
VVLAACGLVALAALWRVVDLARREAEPPGPAAGGYATVREIAGPLELALADGRTVRVAGLAPPQTEAEANRLRSELLTRAPPGSDVFLDPAADEAFGGDDAEAPDAGAHGEAAAAAVWLLPADLDRTKPFPYDHGRLLAAYLVSEGVARADRVAPHRFREELLLLEAEARRQRLGLWTDGP